MSDYCKNSENHQTFHKTSYAMASLTQMYLYGVFNLASESSECISQDNAFRDSQNMLRTWRHAYVCFNIEQYKLRILRYIVLFHVLNMVTVIVKHQQGLVIYLETECILKPSSPCLVIKKNEMYEWTHMKGDESYVTVDLLKKIL